MPIRTPRFDRNGATLRREPAQNIFFLSEGAGGKTRRRGRRHRRAVMTVTHTSI
jgi:hypothetical protein